MDSFDGILKFFNEYAEVEKHGFRLPHWQQPGACYFVTFRLADSIPREKLDPWMEERENWLCQHPKPWTATLDRKYHQRFSVQIERWLDQMQGSCVLRAGDVAALLAEVLMFQDGGPYQFHSWVIMPNHVHGLFSLHPEERIEDRLRNWKGIASRRINRKLGRSGKLWQKNYFDRLIRDGTHFRNVARYIRKNPAKANLRPSEFLLYESPLVVKILEE